jgi:hypothetical protein
MEPGKHLGPSKHSKSYQMEAIADNLNIDFGSELFDQNVQNEGQDFKLLGRHEKLVNTKHNNTSFNTRKELPFLSVSDL